MKVSSSALPVLAILVASQACQSRSRLAPAMPDGTSVENRSSAKPVARRPERGSSVPREPVHEMPPFLATPDISRINESDVSFLKKLPQSDRGFVIAQGDLLLSQSEAMALSRWKVPDGAPFLTIPKDQGGKRLKWKNDTKLVYRIDRASFAQRFHDARGAMVAAATSWNEACPDCPIRFAEAGSHDDDGTGGSDPTVVRFVVRQQVIEGTVALAFGPRYTPEQRILRLTPLFFTSPHGKAGMLRHELGHILGYMHEFEEGRGGCRNSHEGWVPAERLTNADVASVMHYFCPQGDALDLVLSELDKQGHQHVYRPR